MATYNPIGNTEIDAESPITESLMTRLRDNPIAISEGAAGAPKNQTASIAAGAITAALMNADTKAVTGTADNGSVLINGGVRISWIRFQNLQPGNTSLLNWAAAFNAIWFAGAVKNYNGQAYNFSTASPDITQHSTTQVSVRNGGSGQALYGYVFAIGT